MLIVPNDVKCVVCKRIFCCSKCRRKHETDAHEIDEIIAHKNAQKCSLCKGFSALRLELVNDFNFITHLCHYHSPLHCKKCSRVFKTVDDYQDKLNCLNKSEICRLEVLENDLKNLQMSSFYDKNKNLSDVNYVTAGNSNGDSDGWNGHNCGSADSAIESDAKNHLCMMTSTHSYKSSVSIKNSAESLITDSVLSLRNCSSILHASSTNHTIYKSISPTDAAKNIVRQTSTPMQQNRKFINTPDSITCSVSSSVCQVSSIVSESDASPDFGKESSVPPRPAGSNPAPRRSSLGRSARAKLSLAATPLRQVMSKSIQRAIQEHVVATSATDTGPIERFVPTSPLDLRLSPVIRRCQRENQRMPPKQQHFSPDTPDSGHESIKTPPSIEQNPVQVQRSNSSETRRKSLTNLETVYETAKNPESSDECDEQNKSNTGLETNRITVNYSSEVVVKYSSEINGTPAGRSSAELNENTSVNEVWYTPSEVMSTKVVEADEIYTPMLKTSKWPLKRQATHYEEYIDMAKENSSSDENQSINERSNGKVEPSHAPSKLWSFVSSVFGLSSSSSLSTESGLRTVLSNKNTSRDSTPDVSSNISSPFVIKRCASFAGVVDHHPTLGNSHQNFDDDQPNKRRRTSTVNAPVIQDTSKRYSSYRHIKGRQPISRMRDSN